MNLIYYNKYEAIDKRMSECQIGGQRDKHNLFLLNGLIHEVKRSKKNKPIVIQFYVHVGLRNTSLQHTHPDILHPIYTVNTVED